MPSLHELLAEHAPLLLLDAASARVQTGFLEADGRARWTAAEEEAGVALFRGVASLGAAPAAARAFVFCEGPGSILGIRTAAMALRAWNVLAARPVFAFRSLEIVAHDLARPGATGDFSVIADARRETWHCVDVRGGAVGPLRRAPAPELSGALVLPENFRTWSALPPGTRRVGYDLAALLPRVADVDLFRLTGAPDAFLHEDPSYKTWTPHIHGASARP
ncbi:MAG TPA: peptidase M22 [Opitutaceae bacterium]|nr:peptidase M22 [Opitutaceae bacterium]